jgi:Domain of unknown function (DUF4160)
MIYSYDELFGADGPKIDILLRSRDGRKMTFIQRMFLPDGLRQGEAAHILMNFAYEVSRFYGIVVYMFAKDHAPPHCHAKYGENFGLIDIRNGELFEGYLPRRALRIVQDWAELYAKELMDNWNESQKDNPNFRKIPPIK